MRGYEKGTGGFKMCSYYVVSLPFPFFPMFLIGRLEKNSILHISITSSFTAARCIRDCRCCRAAMQRCQGSSAWSPQRVPPSSRVGVGKLSREEKAPRLGLQRDSPRQPGAACALKAPPRKPFRRQRVRVGQANYSEHVVYYVSTWLMKVGQPNQAFEHPVTVREISGRHIIDPSTNFLLD